MSTGIFVTLLEKCAFEFDVSATQHATTPTTIYFEISLSLLLRAL